MSDPSTPPRPSLRESVYDFMEGCVWNQQAGASADVENSAPAHIPYDSWNIIGNGTYDSQTGLVTYDNAPMRNASREPRHGQAWVRRDGATASMRRALRSSGGRERAAARAGVAAGLLVVVAALASACGGRNIVLARLPADRSGTLDPLHRCEPGSSPCEEDPDQDGSRFNNSGTTRIPLPACAPSFEIAQILIEGADSASPVAIVQCAAESQVGLPETGSESPANPPDAGASR